MTRAPLHVWLLACAIAWGLLSLPVARPGGPVLAGTASVIDGDTLEVRGQRIRLHAIDAPEARQTCRRGAEVWRCGQGLAVAYRRYGRDYVEAETDAREARRGMWAGDFAMPWDWRAGGG